jgi:hypothetical protein
VDGDSKRFFMNLFSLGKEYAKIYSLVFIAWSLIYLTKFFAPSVFDFFFDAGFVDLRGSKNILEFAVHLNSHFWLFILVPSVLSYYAKIFSKLAKTKDGEPPIP